MDRTSPVSVYSWQLRFVLVVAESYVSVKKVCDIGTLQLSILALTLQALTSGISEFSVVYYCRSVMPRVIARQKASRQKAASHNAAKCDKIPRLISCDIRPPRQKAAEKNEKGENIPTSFRLFFQLLHGYCKLYTYPCVESIKMHVPLTSKYGSRVLSATYTAILLVCIATSYRNQIIMISYWLQKQRSAFVGFANFLVNLYI